ncbi:hypothetical protein BgiMline_035252 [Biomphalaria glabrata]|nr:hypothetical protein BgiMline_026115 [Biomphalaria glabrata]
MSVDKILKAKKLHQVPRYRGATVEENGPIVIKNGEIVLSNDKDSQERQQFYIRLDQEGVVPPPFDRSLIKGDEDGNDNGNSMRSKFRKKKSKLNRKQGNKSLRYINIPSRVGIALDAVKAARLKATFYDKLYQERKAREKQLESMGMSKSSQSFTRLQFNESICEAALARVRKSRSGPFYLNQMSLHGKAQENNNEHSGSLGDSEHKEVVLRSGSLSNINIEKTQYLSELEELWDLIDKSKRAKPRDLPISNVKSSNTGIFYKAQSDKRRKSIVSSAQTNDSSASSPKYRSPKIVNAVSDWVNFESSCAWQNLANANNGSGFSLEKSACVKKGKNLKSSKSKTRKTKNVDKDAIKDTSNENGTTSQNNASEKAQSVQKNKDSSELVGVVNVKNSTLSNEKKMGTNQNIRQQMKPRKKSPQKSKSRTVSAEARKSPKKHVEFALSGIALERSNNRIETQDSNQPENELKPVIRQAAEPNASGLWSVGICQTERQEFSELTLGADAPEVDEHLQASENVYVTADHSRRAIKTRDISLSNDIGEALNSEGCEVDCVTVDGGHSSQKHQGILLLSKEGSQHPSGSTTPFKKTKIIKSVPSFKAKVLQYALKENTGTSGAYSMSASVPGISIPMTKLVRRLSFGHNSKETKSKCKNFDITANKSIEKLNTSQQNVTGATKHPGKGETEKKRLDVKAKERLSRSRPWRNNTTSMTNKTDTPQNRKPIAATKRDRQAFTKRAKSAILSRSPTGSPKNMTSSPYSKIKSNRPPMPVDVEYASKSGQNKTHPLQAVATVKELQANDEQQKPACCDDKMSIAKAASETSLDLNTSLSLTFSEDVPQFAKKKDTITSSGRRRRAEHPSKTTPMQETFERKHLSKATGMQRKLSVNNNPDLQLKVNNRPEGIQKQCSSLSLMDQDISQLDMDKTEVKSVVLKRLYSINSSLSLSSSHAEDFQKFISQTRAGDNEQDGGAKANKESEEKNREESPEDAQQNSTCAAVHCHPTPTDISKKVFSDGEAIAEQSDEVKYIDSKTKIEQVTKVKGNNTFFETGILKPVCDAIGPRLRGLYRHRKHMTDIKSISEKGETDKESNTYLEMLFKDVIPKVKSPLWKGPVVSSNNIVSSSVDPESNIPPRIPLVGLTASPKKKEPKKYSVKEIIAHLKKAQSYKKTGANFKSDKTRPDIPSRATWKEIANSLKDSKTKRDHFSNHNEEYGMPKSAQAKAKNSVSPRGKRVNNSPRARHWTTPKILMKTRASKSPHVTKVIIPKKVVSFNDSLKPATKSSNKTMAESGIENVGQPLTTSVSEPASVSKNTKRKLPDSISRSKVLSKSSQFKIKQQPREIKLAAKSSLLGPKHSNRAKELSKSKVNLKMQPTTETDDAYTEPPSEAARRQKLAYLNYVKTGTRLKFPENKIQVIKYVSDESKGDGSSSSNDSLSRQRSKIPYRRSPKLDQGSKAAPVLERKKILLGSRVKRKSRTALVKQNSKLQEADVKKNKVLKRNKVKARAPYVRNSRKKTIANTKALKAESLAVAVATPAITVSANLAVRKQEVGQEEASSASDKATAHESRHLVKKPSSEVNVGSRSGVLNFPAKLLRLAQTQTFGKKTGPEGSSQTSVQKTSSYSSGQEATNSAACQSSSALGQLQAGDHDQKEVHQMNSTPTTSGRNVHSVCSGRQRQAKKENNTTKRKKLKMKKISQLKPSPCPNPHHQVTMPSLSGNKLGRLPQPPRKKARKKIRKAPKNLAADDGPSSQDIAKTPSDQICDQLASLRIDENIIKIATDNFLKPGQKMFSLAYNRLRNIVVDKKQGESSTCVNAAVSHSAAKKKLGYRKPKVLKYKKKAAKKKTPPGHANMNDMDGYLRDPEGKNSDTSRALQLLSTRGSEKENADETSKTSLRSTLICQAERIVLQLATSSME